MTTQENTIRLFVSNQVKDNIQPFDTFQAQYGSAHLSIGVPSMHVAGSEATSSNIQLTVRYAGKYYNIEQDEQAAEYVMSVNGGRRSVPTLVSGEVAHSLSGFRPQKLDAFLAEAGL